MKKSVRLLLVVLCAVMLVCTFGVFSYADDGAAVKQGWSYDEDGKERYYKNGSALTGGPHNIGDFQYMFADDGEYLSMYDAFKNVGTAGVMDTDAFKTAVAARNPATALTFDAGTKYGNSQSSLSDVPVGGTALVNNLSGTKQVHFNSSGQPFLVLRQAEYAFVPKNGSTSNLAFTFGHVPAEIFTPGDAHTYIDRSSLASLYNTGFVIDFEIKLTEMPSAGFALIDVSDRRQSTDPKENNFTGMDTENILSMNKGGFIYSSKNTGALVASAAHGEFVRISLAIDNKNNKFDIYTNGVLMLDDLVLYDNANQPVEEFKIEETRMFQFSNSSLQNDATVVLDNFYIYPGTTPVCTETPTLKNGIHVDGSYIRNYYNGLIIPGNALVNGTYFGQQINEYISFDANTGAGFVGYRAKISKDGVVTSNSIVKDNIFVAPKAVDLKGKLFVGWKTVADDFSKLMVPGDSVRIKSNITAEALGIGVSLLDGASVKTVPGTSSLRFMAKVSKQDYDSLTALGVAIEPHIIIAPTSTVRAAHGYTEYEHLAAASTDQLIDVKATSWYQTDKNKENAYYYTAEIEGITDILKEYSAIAYLKLTMPNGDVNTIYADYNEENNSRSVYYVSDKAYNDRTSKSGFSSYSQKIDYAGKATYSPYNTSELSAFKTFLDKVVVINSSDEGITAGGAYYDSSYAVKLNTQSEGVYNVTLGSDGTWTADKLPTVIIDGKIRDKSSYNFENGKITLDIDSGWVTLEAEDMNNGNSWIAVNVKDEYTIFNNNKKLTLPGSESTINVPVAPNGETVAARWTPISNYNSKGEPVGNPVTLSNSVYFQSLKYTTGGKTYFDLSKLRSISFWVYVPNENVGTTTLVQFSSENAADEAGSDYYSTTLTFSKVGWSQYTINFNSIGISRSPLGWDKIDSVKLVPTGWDQQNKTGVRLYFTNFIVSDTEKGGGLAFGATLSKDGGAVFANGGFKGIVDGSLVTINPDDTAAVSYKKDGIWYLPLNVFAAAKDEYAQYYKNSKFLQFYTDDDDYTFVAGDSYYTLNGVKKALETEIFEKDGALYITHTDAMKVFGYGYMYEDQMELLVLSKDPNIADLANDQDNVFSLIKELIYVRPTGEQLVEDMEEYSQFKHPYLMLDEKAWEDLKYYYEHDPLLKEYLAKREASYGIGSNNFKAEPRKFSRTDGRRLLSISRDVMEKTVNWAVMYKIGDYTPEEKQLLFDRIWAEVHAACNFYDEEKYEYSWNPSHFLDTAELAYPIALMYDWFYDQWTKEQRDEMAKAMYELALVQTSSIAGGASYNLGGSTNNWNGVCNGGIMAAALAIVNDEWIIANGYRNNVIKVINDSVLGVEKGMWVYAPEGGYEEGPGYWSYGSTYVHIWISCVQTACGTNYGLYASPGFEKSVLFTTYLGNGMTTWGFHDGGSGNATPGITGWFSQMSGNGVYNTLKRTANELGWTSSVSIYDVMWFNPHIVDNSLEMRLDSHYSLDTIMTFRSSWDTSNNIFAGLHGGDNAASHGDLDTGNFVIDVNGTYMICDLGADAYNMAGYFGTNRWSYYKKRTEGQNTLVMLNHGESWDGKTGKPEYLLDANGNVVYNTAEAEYIVSEGKKYTFVVNPSTGKKKLGTQVGTVSDWKPEEDYLGQIRSSVSKAVDFQSGLTKAFGIVDMKPAYNSKVNPENTMHRGLYMTDNRSTVIIQDEGVFKTAQDIWWFAHTQGNITIIEGGKAAYIQRNGIYLYAEIVEDPSTPVNAKFTEMAAVSLDNDYVGDLVESGVYSDEVEQKRTSYTKLCIEVDNVSTYNIAVAFKVIASPSVLPELGTIYSWTPMNQWTVD